jgi:hypothetical protein
VIAWGWFAGFKKLFFNPAPPEKAPVLGQPIKHLKTETN